MKEIVTAARAPAAIGPYSHAVAAGGLLFTSGQIALVPETGALAGDTIEEQTEQVLKNLEAGVTYLQGKGGFTGKDKEIVFCAVHGPQGPQVEEIVKEEDPSAFMIVTSASEIYGEGYKDLFADVL